MATNSMAHAAYFENLAPRMAHKPANVFIDMKLPDSFAAADIEVTSGQTRLPVGKIIFFDGTIPPGRLKISIGGHLIDIMPGSVEVDGREVSRTSKIGGAGAPPSVYFDKPMEGGAPAPPPSERNGPRLGKC
ncbi:MAG: hypothetical protein PHV34_03905 [Verrucomicrobiae bacterium]|nr:hypothetical protein [Verrucomicrobiae bacterium]